MWVDGVAQTMTGSDPGTTLGDGGASAFEVGKNTTSLVDGYVADLKMWARALTAAEVIQETYSWRPRRWDNLFLWCPYIDIGDMKDYSGAGNHGTNASATTAHIKSVSRGDAVMVL
jgi:hypothetical protein